MRLAKVENDCKLERNIQASILNYLNSVSAAYRLTAQRRGSPDIIAVYKGRLVAFEVKREKKSTLKNLQIAEAKRLLRCDAFVFFVASLEEAKTSLSIVDALLSGDIEEAWNLIRTKLRLAQPIAVEILTEGKYASS